MRYALIVLWMLLCPITSATAQVGISIRLPSVSIGIYLPLYPELVPVPGYPVYYAPQMSLNFFFYDGMYWVYQRDNWYASSWYDGPWGLVAPEIVPLFILRIPVRYYRNPPAYFRGWRPDEPPRWGERWGNRWELHRRGWDRWDRHSVPAPAPLPVYQRQYSGDRYPRLEQQQELRHQNYLYQPHDPVVRQHYQDQERQRAPARSQPGRQDSPAVPRSQPPQRERADVQRSAPTQAPPQQRGPAIQDQRQQRQQQGKGSRDPPERRQGPGQEKGQGRE